MRGMKKIIWGGNWKGEKSKVPRDLLPPVGQLFLSLCCTGTGGYDHTNMTAPLPVCSAKLSIVGPG